MRESWLCLEMDFCRYMKTKHVFIVADAFRHDYISLTATPFLYSIASSGIWARQVKPSAGFCERSEFMLGLKSCELDLLSAFRFDPQSSPYAKIHWILKVFDLFKVERFGFLNRVVRRLLWSLMSRVEGGYAPVNIPFGDLRFFSLAEDGPGSSLEKSDQSIKRLVERRGSYSERLFTSLCTPLAGSDIQRLFQLVDEFNSGKDFVVVYLSGADKFGHLYGPDSENFKIELRRLDRMINEALRELNASGINYEISFLGDHGMTEVKSKFDIGQHVRDELSELSAGVDYAYFVDSTIFRLWALNGRAREVVSAFKLELESGHSYFSKLDRTGKKFSWSTVGDLALIAEPGILFSPDSFNRNGAVVRGMHGYDPEVSTDMLGCFFHYRDEITPFVLTQIELSDVYDILKQRVLSSD